MDPENNKQCSQSSSSDSTGSRSPPETPPVAPWMSNEVNVPLTTDEPQQQHVGMVQVPPPPQHSRMRKNHSHVMRNKNHSSMVNGGTPIPQSIPQPTSLQCMTFSGPHGPTPMPAYLAHHTHFPALRPTTGIYSNFPHAAYARPAPATAGFHTLAPYPSNGEMMYQYPGHPPPGSSAAISATGTPPPPPPAVAAAAAVSAVQGTSNPVQQQQAPQQPTPQHHPQTLQHQTPVLQNYVPVVPPGVAYAPIPPPPPKISCYNCGSNSHVASDCKEQTMEDITRGGTILTKINLSFFQLYGKNKNFLLNSNFQPNIDSTMQLQNHQAVIKARALKSDPLL